MNVKGIRGNGMPIPAASGSSRFFGAGLGGVNTHPSDSRRSAEPDEEVEALLPCYEIISNGHCVRDRNTNLDNPCTSTSSNYSCCCAHVERVVAVPAGTHDINDEILGVLDICDDSA